MIGCSCLLTLAAAGGFSRELTCGKLINKLLVKEKVKRGNDPNVRTCDLAFDL